LCNIDSGKNSHLIFFCSYTKEVWREEKKFTGLKNSWYSTSINESLKNGAQTLKHETSKPFLSLFLGGFG